MKPSEYFLDADDIFDILEDNKQLFKNTIIKCPNCKENSNVFEFDHNEVEAECCGTHCAILCPKCDSVFECPISNDIFLIIET